MFMYAIRINVDSYVQEYRVYTLGQFMADTSLNTAPDINGLYWVFIDHQAFLSQEQISQFIQHYTSFYYDARYRTMIQSSLSGDSGSQSPGTTSIQEFLYPGTYNLQTPPGATSYLLETVLAGGGGGGRSSEYQNGWCFSSGGAGGLIQNVSGKLTSSQTMTIVVGAGGLMESDGGNSTVTLGTDVIATATGGKGWKSQSAAPGGTPGGNSGLAGVTGTGGSLAGVAGADSPYGKGGAAGNPFATPFTPGYINQDGTWTYEPDPDNSCVGGDATGYGAGGGSAGWRIGVIPIGWNNNGQTCPSWCLGSNGEQEYQGFQWRGGKGSGGYVKIVFYFT